jgi:hypothetical protein
MDATAGDGDPFWELYTEHLLPPPEEVTLPMAWGPELLQQLQHNAIIEGAQKQQVRTARLVQQLQHDAIYIKAQQQPIKAATLYGQNQ